MSKIVYAHQADQLAERSIAEFCQTLRLGAVDQVRIKVCQWLTWTGRFDDGPGWDIESMDALLEARNTFEAEGIEFFPWGCPMGLDAAGDTAVDAAGVEAEAQRFAAIANACGKVDLDIEPYAEFWPALVGGDYRAVGPFFRRLRELAPTAQIVVDLPYRDAAWSGDEDERMSPVIELASPFVEAFYLQSYFGVEQAQDAERRARQHTQRPIYHIADCAHLPAMLTWLDGVSVEHVAVWVAQNMNLALYQQLAARDFGGPGTVAGTIPWHDARFAALRHDLGSRMGEPTELAVTDNLGNVFQESALGFALWKKTYDASFWMPRPFGLANCNRLNLRARPDPDQGAILRTLEQGDRLTLESSTARRLAGGALWVNVKTADGTVGWVNRAFTEIPEAALVVDGGSPPHPATR